MEYLTEDNWIYVQWSDMPVFNRWSWRSATVGVPLAAGTYRVVATNTTSLCTSPVTLFTVNDVSVTPAITQNTIINNTNCSGATPNGSITIDVDGGVPAAVNFEIQWYSDIGTSSAIVGATVNIINPRGRRLHSRSDRHTFTGLYVSSTATFTIIDDLPVFTINSALITVGNQTDCVGNGSAEVTDILINGVSNAEQLVLHSSGLMIQEFQSMDLAHLPLLEFL